MVKITAAAAVWVDQYCYSSSLAHLWVWTPLSCLHQTDFMEDSDHQTRYLERTKDQSLCWQNTSERQRSCPSSSLKIRLDLFSLTCFRGGWEKRRENLFHLPWTLLRLPFTSTLLVCAAGRRSFTQLKQTLWTFVLWQKNLVKFSQKYYLVSICKNRLSLF